jgi:hypothetical protein
MAGLWTHLMSSNGLGSVAEACRPVRGPGSVTAVDERCRGHVTQWFVLRNCYVTHSVAGGETDYVNYVLAI